MNTESKSRYKTTNWSEYNQALRQRGAFTIWFDPQMQWSATPTGKKGRQPTYTDIAIQFALTDDTKPVPTGFTPNTRFHSKLFANGSPRLECSRLLNIESASR